MDRMSDLLGSVGVDRQSSHYRSPAGPLQSAARAGERQACRGAAEPLKRQAMGEHSTNTCQASEAPKTADRLARGVCRLLADMGFRALPEFKLTNRRRADVAGLDKGGRFAIVEIKSSPADFRGDGKWPEYRPHCDLFYFAIDEDFPRHLLPDDCGLIVADAYHATVVREAVEAPMNASRRRAQTRRFALTAAARLRALLDPRR
jgi:hypothetical protein